FMPATLPLAGPPEYGPAFAVVTHDARGAQDDPTPAVRGLPRSAAFELPPAGRHPQHGEPPRPRGADHQLCVPGGHGAVAVHEHHGKARDVPAAVGDEPLVVVAAHHLDQPVVAVEAAGVDVIDAVGGPQCGDPVGVA